MNPTQEAVAGAVRERGYHNTDILTTEQLAARHVAKLVEELAEVIEHVKPKWEFTPAWMALFASRGESARSAFDRLGSWAGYSITDLEEFKSELADLQVVLLSMSSCWISTSCKPRWTRRRLTWRGE